MADGITLREITICTTLLITPLVQTIQMLALILRALQDKQLGRTMIFTTMSFPR
ncbi:MAG: hypothetical protein PHV87_03065 [Bacilli bacterium]|nr:hypothetical protein [Bacilli bacterium]